MKNPNAAFWSALFVIGFFMPVIGFSLVINFILEHRHTNEIRALRNFADSAAQQLHHAADNRQFWCHELNRAFSLSDTPEAMEAALKSLATEHRQKMFRIIWDGNDHVVSCDIRSHHPYPIWERVGNILRNSAKIRFQDIPKSDDTFIRSVLGQHVQTKTFYRATITSNPDLNDLSFSFPSGSFWADFKDDFGVMVLLPPGLEKKTQGLQKFIGTIDLQNNQIGLVRDGSMFSSHAGLTWQKLRSMQNYFTSRAPEICRDAETIFTGRFAGNDLFLFIARKPVSFSPTRCTILFTLILSFLWILAAGSIHHSGFKAGFSIKYIVIGLITCSNIFPLLAMGILGQQYLEQKRQILIEDRRLTATDFLNRLEGEFVAETHKIQNFAIHHIQHLGKILKNEPLTLENTLTFRKIMSGVAGKFMVVASTTYPAISDVAFLSDKESFLIDADGSRKVINILYNESNRLKLNETLSKCGAAFISYYNGTSIPEKVLMEAEVIIEAIFQNSMNATFHRFIRLLEHVENLGMGTEKHPTFMHFLSFNPEKLADYLFMFHFHLGVHAQNFLAARNAALKGNQHGLKVVYALDDKIERFEISPFSDRDKFRKLFARLTSSPNPSAEFVDIDGETWMYTGLISKTLAQVSLLALAPLSQINDSLEQEKTQLLMAMLLNILLVAGITLIFVQTLLDPVALLQTGTDAIKARDFSYRIPEAGRDEFGRMARVFNSALADLEEMSLARDVQQQLFPRQQVETGAYDVFCKTVTMADLGGDYLDVFMIGSDRFIMVLGDVAGHGVGAAMIMAMAKAAMLNSTDLLDQPSALLSRLHDLIYRTKTRKQKKIMTFQCLVIDTSAHKVIFANAGGCNPFVVRAKTRRAEEIIVKGVALGSFKNSSFSQTEIILEPGDTMVLYTDGLIESRNNSGEEVGFERFGRMLADNLCSSSQQFYDRIMHANRIWRQDQPRQDDLSLMILRRG